MKNSPAFVELTFAISHLGAVSLPDQLPPRRRGGRLHPRPRRRQAAALRCRARPCRRRLPQRRPRSTRPRSTTARASPDRAAPGADARRQARRPLPPHVHLGHHRPSQGRHAQLRQLLLEERRPRPGAGPRRPRRLLVAGPLYHVGAFDLPGMAVLWVGGAISILRDFDAAARAHRNRRARSSPAPGSLRSCWAASSPTPSATPTT